MTNDLSRIILGVRKWNVSNTENKSHLLTQSSGGITITDEGGLFEVETRNKSSKDRRL